MMKILFILVALISNLHASSIRGKVTSPAACNSDLIMVWLGNVTDDFTERKLLMHTEVPNGGSFEFYVKPGEYEVRGSTKEGCGFIQKMKVAENESKNILVKLESK
jgi:hypothetical protein